MTSLVEKANKLTTAAQHHDKELRRLWRGMRSDWYKLGQHALAIWEGDLWKHLCSEEGKPYRSFDGYLKATIPEASRSTIYAARKAYQQLKGIPEAELTQIPKGNGQVLQYLPKKLRHDPTWIKRAQNLSEREFKARVKAELPEVDFNERHSVKFYLTEAQHGIIEEALEVAAWKGETQDRNEAMEMLAVDWLDTNCGLEEYAGLSNRDAFRQAGVSSSRKDS